MKRLVAITVIFTFIFIGFISPKGWAEKRSGSFTITPNIGGYLFEGDQNLRHGLTYGFGLGYYFKENWTAEGSFNYIDTKFDDGDGDVDGYLYRFDALYDLRPSKTLTPFIAAGIGRITLDPDWGDSDTDFLFNYGLGFKYFLKRNIALRGDIRHVISFDDTEHNMIYTLGLTFLFGVPKDSDGDGVYDDLDKCPRTPAGVKVDSYGCPLDTDGDGVYDYLDKCPDTPQGVEVDVKGCPLDTDGDGVSDYLDKCPDTPKEAKVDSRGCWVLKGLRFDSAKWSIKPQSYPVLDEVITVLKRNPYLKVEIQGHTDNRGEKRYNQKLSENRAKSVMMYMVKEGIEPGRLKAVGYGFSRPAASNTTPEGRAKNRRVELQPIR